MSAPPMLDRERWKEEQRRIRGVLREQRGEAAGHAAARPPHPATAPLASVIVVCWNAAEVIERCLSQLLLQDHPNYEVIVVDDGSQDGTFAIAEAALAGRPAQVVRSPRNRGCPHSRNIGLRHARGEVVAFIDADGFAAPDWLSRLTEAFDADPRVGGVASTVFLEGNPLVINGAGGTVNRQGWAADLCMNESYERAQIAAEALYPMGCGMALRRAALERTGAFDDRMLNYYDDVDYGIRLWRGGFRVAVAPDAWIDHDFGGSGKDGRKRLLCERHRMRVVLKHGAPAIFARWIREEARGIRRAPQAERAVKLRALLWNVRHCASVVASRWGTRRAPSPPDRLIDGSWGDGFPAGVPVLFRPRPELARETLDMADARSKGQLLYGWFPLERAAGRSYRWAAPSAGALLRCSAPATRLRLDLAHVPVDTGGIDVAIRSVDASDRLEPVWSTHLPWQYSSRSVQNHPIELGAGFYEVLFSARRGWREPPLETRSLGFALASLSLGTFEEIASGGLDMASSSVEGQLVEGWYEGELSEDRGFRWASGSASAVVRLSGGATSARLAYRLPPGVHGGLRVTARPAAGGGPAWSAQLPSPGGEWHEESVPLRLGAGDYLVTFAAASTWSNPGRRDPSLWAENRELGFAISELAFETTG